MNQLLAGSRADVVIKVFGDDLVVAQGDRRPHRPGRQGRPRTRRLARAARARPAVARGHPRSRSGWPATAYAADEVLEVVEASRVGRFAGQDLRGLTPVRSDVAAAAREPDHGGVRRAAGELAERAARPAGVGRDDPRDRGAGGHQPRGARAPRAGRGQRARPRSGRLRATRRAPRSSARSPCPRRPRRVGWPVRELHRARASGWAWSSRSRSASSSRCCS